MKTRQILLLACLTGWSPSLWAQTQRSPIDTRIQNTFRAVDLDKNGTISPREAAKAGIKARSFAFYDANKDRRLGSDEFQTYYQKLLQQRQAERERRRLEEEERLRKEAEAKKAEKGQDADPAQPAPQKPNTQKPNPNAQGPNGPKERDGQPQGQPPVAPAGQAGGEVPAKPATPAAQDNAEQPIVSAQKASKDPKAQAKPVAENANIDPVVRPGAEKVPGKTDAELLAAEKAARGTVQRLLKDKHISAQEGRDLYQSLSVGVRGEGGTIGLTEWRTALNNSKTRVTALVRSGALSAQEGRALYDLFEERARRAVQASGSTPEKVAKETPKQPAKGSSEANQPATNAKPEPDFRQGNEDLKGLTDAQLAKLQHDAERAQNARERLRLQNYRDALRIHNAREALRKAEESKANRQKQQAAEEAERRRKLAQEAQGKAKPGASPVVLKPSGQAAKDSQKKPVGPQGQPTERSAGKTPAAQRPGNGAKPQPQTPQAKAEQAKRAELAKNRQNGTPAAKTAEKQPQSKPADAKTKDGAQPAAKKPTDKPAEKPAPKAKDRTGSKPAEANAKRQTPTKRPEPPATKRPAAKPKG